MADRPLVRDRHVMREDDQWYLDRWTGPGQHVVRSYYRERVIGPRADDIERVYIARCACGWQSLEHHLAVTDQCPVGEALAEREKRKRKPGQRIQWRPL